jgi:hypothetical protein
MRKGHDCLFTRNFVELCTFPSILARKVFSRGTHQKLSFLHLLRLSQTVETLTFLPLSLHSLSFLLLSPKPNTVEVSKGDFDPLFATNLAKRCILCYFFIIVQCKTIFLFVQYILSSLDLSIHINITLIFFDDHYK